MGQLPAIPADDRVNMVAGKLSFPAAVKRVASFLTIK
jgi:hypothetical protein